MARMKPRGDTDFIIMSSAQDESTLVELVAEYLNDYPAKNEGDAKALLMKRLAELVRDGKVGVSRYQDDTEQSLSAGDALAVIRQGETWAGPASTQHHIFQKDKTYFGKYYGEKSHD